MNSYNFSDKGRAIKGFIVFYAVCLGSIKGMGLRKVQGARISFKVAVLQIITGRQQKIF